MVTLDDKNLNEIDFITLNINIEKCLNEISKYPVGGFLKGFIKIEDNSPKPIDSFLLVEYMVLEGLITVKNGLTFKLTKLGYEVVRNDGWIKHLKRKKDKIDKTDRKLNLDLQVSKIKARTFIPVLILGAFGGIYSGIKIIKDLGILKRDQQIQETKQQTEKEQTKSHTLILDQENLDSLHNSNQEKLVPDNKKQLDSI